MPSWVTAPVFWAAFLFGESGLFDFRLGNVALAMRCLMKYSHAETSFTATRKIKNTPSFQADKPIYI
ncbi:hypothetical protein TMES_18485 [Thalassospira mesophila]|uniref:Uncharacterized protein n=1 Tax=Thalassospira mesophila TaxID=1293891 RepID=A0A1Y2KWL6_9PROT|nr:hypothetical protein TMES_18485 [Thalassospira mesophila]